MSIQALTEFRAKVRADEALQSEVRRAFAQGGEGIPALAQKHGYAFTEEEARALPLDELSDLELELVSAGTGNSKSEISSLGSQSASRGETP